MSRRGMAGTGQVLGELTAVNVLGVPGAALGRVLRGVPVTPRDSLRHAVLFTLSWFTGAWTIEQIVGRTRSLPGIGRAVTGTTTTFGAVFITLTDVTRPVGALTVGSVIVAMVRYAGRVERAVIGDGAEPGRTCRETPLPPAYS